MHFIYQINRLTTTKVDSTYLCCLANNAHRICPVAKLERMTNESAVSTLPYLATQVDVININTLNMSAQRFFDYLKTEVIKSYIDVCIISNCYVCDNSN